MTTEPQKNIQGHELERRELLARQGLRFPAIILRHLRDAGIYCQLTVSIEHQHLAKRYVLRGAECGGAVPNLGAYASFTDEQGNALAWLQRVDTVGVNGVHAIVVAPALIRIEMLRVQRTYDVLITRHELRGADQNQRPRLESSILFYGRRGTLEMELWGKDAAFRGAVCPAFYSRSGEAISVPVEFQDALARISAAVCCVGCRHCHLLQPKTAFTVQSQSAMQPQFCPKLHADMNNDAPADYLPPIEQILGDRAASLWIKAALRSALSRDPVDAANDAAVLARLLERRCRSDLNGDQESRQGIQTQLKNAAQL
jgi:hypothetical protein